jgi:hypothetical protein
MMTKEEWKRQEAVSAKEMIGDNQWRCWQRRAKVGNGSGQD